MPVSRPHQAPKSERADGRARAEKGVAQPIALVVALLAVALNLRIAIASVSPVLGQIQRDTGISSTVAGLLTTIPVVCFGVFAAVTPRLIRRLGMGQLLWVVVAVLVAGIALRLAPSLVGLLAGTAVLGAAVAVGNVLLPGLLRRDFPQHLALMTGLYSVALNASGSLSTGLTVPLEHLTGLGWRPTLALWGVPALLALALWSRQLHTRRNTVPAAAPTRVLGLWRDPVARVVAGFMGLQSLGFYATLAWIPTLFRSHHLSAAEAGWLLSFATFPAIGAAFVTPALTRRLRYPGLAVVIVVSLCAVGYLGLASDPVPLAYLWMAALGAGQGAALSLALGFIVQYRAPDVHHTAQLSTMAQTSGYLIASVGPLGLGALHQFTGSWTIPMLALTVLLVPELLAGLAASLDRHVQSVSH